MNSRMRVVILLALVPVQCVPVPPEGTDLRVSELEHRTSVERLMTKMRGMRFLTGGISVFSGQPLPASLAEAAARAPAPAPANLRTA